ncbi:efflux RND transporter periplasmic adaptor subunit [Chlorobaculum sp. MV4-Y]|uniref:efflux RND transporter periplasmic adaptor subunit n=1 Tax=Chlorobaculum sp. MV4-Y TaxID=2976335 RepID=UPI0021AF402C|nr:efflux RND transporter periplasmic adaptor subunit [Chlorobaculum sp. MV4-Y]UWX58680.1 efflux RND transporter periplasmic adaptor subunit [Chlorobaculum sp. MV4-Y]
MSAKSSRDHTYRVESVMDNPKETPIRAGMFARTAFVGSASRQALLIPRRALNGSIADAEVFVVSGGRASRTSTCSTPSWWRSFSSISSWSRSTTPGYGRWW